MQIHHCLVRIVRYIEGVSARTDSPRYKRRPLRVYVYLSTAIAFRCRPVDVDNVAGLESAAGKLALYRRRRLAIPLVISSD